MDEIRQGLVDVRFVGGPLHGVRVAMASPSFKMTMEPSPGQRVEYCRRMVETIREDQPQIATYAPTGISDSEFSRLVLEAARSQRR